MVTDLIDCLLLSCITLLGAIAIPADHFNEGLATRIFTRMNCLGNESNLLECDGTPFRNISCPTSGVICQGKKMG